MLECSRGTGLVYESGQYSSCLIIHCCRKVPHNVTSSLLLVLCGVHSLIVPFLDPVRVAVAFV